MENKKKLLIKNTYVFSVLVRILLLFVGVIHSMFVARFLGAELKGISTTIISAVSLFQVIITFGMHQAYPYFKKEGKIDNFKSFFLNNIYLIYIILFCFSFLALLFFSRWLSIKTCLIIILIPFFSYENIVSYVYLIENPFKKNLWSLIASVVETIVILLLWIFVEPNNVFMVVCISFATLLKSFIATIALRIRPSFKKISLNFIIRMIRFGFFPMLALLLTILNSKIDVLMMDWGGTVSNVDIGVYSVGIGISDKILAIPDAIREILLGKLVHGKGEKEVAKVTRISVFICLICAIIVLLLGRYLILILYGNEYIKAYKVLVISSIGTIFMVFLKMISQFNIVNKKQFSNFLMLSISVIVNLLFNLILIPCLGIEGAAIASLIGHCVCALCFIFYFINHTNVKLRDLLFIKKTDINQLIFRNKDKL